MAKEPKQASAPKIEFDALAETVVPDPATIADSVALAGFVGRSAEDGKIRLYVDAGFRNYYEISSSDILHSQQLPATQSPLGGSVVYVRSSAPCGGCRFQRKSKPGFCRARCRMPARARPACLLYRARIGHSLRSNSHCDS